MIKDLNSLMLRLEYFFQEAIHQITYFDLQNFVKTQLNQMISRLTNMKDEIHKKKLLAVCCMCSDFKNQSSRRIGPSSTQVRSILISFSVKTK